MWVAMQLLDIFSMWIIKKMKRERARKHIYICWWYNQAEISDLGVIVKIEEHDGPRVFSTNSLIYRDVS